MKTKLQEYFPMIRSREEILKEINENTFLKNIFYNWSEEQQMQFLDYCSGAKGVKILYDSYFKEVFSPETAPERLETLLSLFLKKKVKILQILPNDTVRISDEESLLVTDIIVQLEDGSLANIEVQKISYLFPGQRAACYGADLLLRQYKRVRSEKKKDFRYKDIKDVYVIVFFETSPQEFHAFPDTYCHFFEQKSDTGLQLNLLEKFIFIPLDIFRKNIHNKETKNELDAWLSFLILDSPEDIVALIEEHPEFKPLYQHIYDMCQNVERMIGMFSEELRIMDKNTVRYMVDQMQQEINEKNLIMKKQTEKLQEQEAQIKELIMQIQELKDLVQTRLEETHK